MRVGLPVRSVCSGVVAAEGALPPEVEVEYGFGGAG